MQEKLDKGAMEGKEFSNLKYEMDQLQ